MQQVLLILSAIKCGLCYRMDCRIIFNLFAAKLRNGEEVFDAQECWWILIWNAEVAEMPFDL